jgi:acyl-homoserine-lactone acylase
MNILIQHAKNVTIFGAALLAAVPSFAESPAPAYNAEIIRDAYGVPHIHGHTDADTAYGLAYAAAEDNFATMQDLAAVGRGQLGLLQGKKGAIFDYAREFLGVATAVERDYDKQPADVRAMLEAYAAGANRYAETHPKEVRSNKLFPLKGRDIAAGFALVSLNFYGISDDLAKLYNNQQPVPETPERGSNGFAIAPRRMADGKTWLIANPHLPYEGPYSWYEAVVHSDEGLDMAGATLIGSPFLFIGHNRNLGWTVTLNHPDLIDVYKLTLNPKGDQYLFDGKWLPLERRQVKLPVKAGIINVTATRDVVRSVHGPVIFNKQGAFAVRFAGMDSISMVEQYYRLTKAQDWTQWQAAMNLGGIPSTNYVYADKNGRVAYVYNGLFPNRKPGFDYSGILAGDTSANVWQGYGAFSAMPKVVDPASGFVFNANNSPFHAAGEGSNLHPADFPKEMGIEARMTNRAWRAEELLSASDIMTPEALMGIKFDTAYSRKSYVAAWMAKLLAVDTAGRPDLAEAQMLLRTWDWNSDGTGSADAFAEVAILPAKQANYAQNNLPDPQKILEQDVLGFKKKFGRLDPPLSEILRLRRGNVNLPVIGGTDALRTANLAFANKQGDFKVGSGDSFIMTISWDKQGVVSSQSVIPYGSSTMPESPHYTDQMQLFTDRKFKPVHFEWADVLALGGKPYRP